jgi:hypothetical protein
MALQIRSLRANLARHEVAVVRGLMAYWDVKRRLDFVEVKLEESKPKRSNGMMMIQPHWEDPPIWKTGGERKPTIRNVRRD